MPARALAMLLPAAMLALLPAAPGGEKDSGDGFIPMFNGKDLSGWVNVNCAPETFFVKDGMIVTTGKPTGFLRTDKQYENFIAEFDWMHVPPTPDAVGNSGFFVWADPLPAVGSPYTRGIEVQVLVNLEWKDKKTGGVTASSHGDLFSIWGARCVPDRPHPLGWERCIPSENRAKGAGEWNHYRVEANDGVIKLAVNGKVVSGISKCVPRKGYLALESEGSECRFKDLKIKELPSTRPTTEETADVARDFRPLLVGDLRFWKADEEHQKHWKFHDWVLDYDGKCPGKDPHLWTEKEYGDFELIADWRWSAKPKKMQRPVILPTGEVATENGKEKTAEVDDAGDSGIYLRGSEKAQVNLWCWPVGSGEVWGYRTDKSQPADVRAACTPKVAADKPIGQWNRIHIRMKGDRLTVDLNGKRVIDDARLPGVPARGPIALQHHGDPIQFGNIFIRELAKSE
jgi:hypothetical protein